MASYNKDTEGITVVDAFKDEIQGKTIVITGASDGGLGAETAVSLAHANPAHLILLARSENKVTPLVSKIKDLNSSIKVDFVPVELDDFESVRQAADTVNSRVSKLDILINNAGVMALPEYRTNKAGIELQFATNHLGHFLLTALVYNKIMAAGKGARIVNLASNGHRIGPFRTNDYNFKEGADYDAWSAYGQSKTSNILFTRQLASRGVLSYAVHPGVIFATNLSHNVTDFDTFAQKLEDATIKNTGKPYGGLGEAKSLQAGVSTTLVASLDPSVAKSSGTYWEDCQIHDLPEYASSSENAQKLWDISEKLVGEKFEL